MEYHHLIVTDQMTRQPVGLLISIIIQSFRYVVIKKAKRSNPAPPAGSASRRTLDAVREFTCGTGGAARSVGRNLPAIHVCQTDVWLQTHIKVIAAETETDRQGHFL